MILYTRSIKLTDVCLVQPFHEQFGAHSLSLNSERIIFTKFKCHISTAWSVYEAHRLSLQAWLTVRTKCMFPDWVMGGLVNATGDIVGNKYKVLHPVCILLANYWWPWQCSSDQSNPQEVFGEANFTRWQLATSSSHSPTSEGTHTFP